MFLKFMRNNKVVAGLLTFIRIYLGYQWMTAGFGKITGGFDAGGFLQGSIASGNIQGWWTVFLEKVAVPNAGMFSFVVMWGEFLVGIALILGIFTSFSALMGITMNFAFLFSGTVSTNAQMVILTLFILVAGHNAGKYGLDRWVIPFIKNYTKKERINKEVVNV